MSLELLSNVKNFINSSSGEIKLDLSNQGISDKDVEKLVELFKQYPNRKIKNLNLYCNNITDTGANMLSTLENVREINLAYNRIKDSGAKSLIQNKQLKGLDLSDNSISNNFVDFIVENTKQIYLNLAKNKIQQNDLLKIQTAVDQNKSLSASNTMLTFSSSPISSKQKIQEATNKKPELTGDEKEDENLIGEIVIVFKKHNIQIGNKTEFLESMKELCKVAESFNANIFDSSSKTIK